MKLQRRDSLDRYGLLGIAIIVFIGAYILSGYVRLYGDDFFYSVFTTQDFSYFVKRHMEHYQLANGRAIVHILATSFLGMNHIYWSICNGLMLASIVYFGAKIAFHMEVGSRGKMICGGIIMASTIGLLNPHMTRQSVYWMTGSFNYVYPICMLLIYWFFLNKSFYQHQYKWYVPVLGFLSAATVEQGSLMTFGLTLLVCLDLVFMKKYKWNKWMTITLLTVTVGMLSVICSPAVLLRASLENTSDKGLLEIIRENVKNQGFQFLFTKYMAPFHILTLGGAWGAILGLYRKSKKALWIKIGIFFLGGTGSIGLLIHLYLNSTLYTPKIMSMAKIMMYLWIGVGYLLTLFYSAILIYKYKWIKNYTLPLIALILGVGSQMMLLILPVYGPRNLLFIVFMFALYSTALIPHVNRWGVMGVVVTLLCLIMEVTWALPLAITGLVLTLFLIKDSRHILGKVGVILSYGTLVIIVGVLMLPTVRGYRNNSIIYDDNLAIAEAYDGGESGTLMQHSFVTQPYGWVMPFENDYYTKYYKIYIDVDRQTKIQWN